MKTIIVDLDGTLCDIRHRLHHIQGKKRDYDAFHAACVNDTPKQIIIDLVNQLSDFYKIIICSGRSDSVKDKTIQWLKDNKVNYSDIVMRQHGDHTHDDVLKRQWLEQGLLGEKQDIAFVLDDRCRVVDMWRDQGLTCLQVDKWENKL